MAARAIVAVGHVPRRLRRPARARMMPAALQRCAVAGQWGGGETRSRAQGLRVALSQLERARSVATGHDSDVFALEAKIAESMRANYGLSRRAKVRAAPCCGGNVLGAVL